MIAERNQTLSYHYLILAVSWESYRLFLHYLLEDIAMQKEDLK